MGPLMSPSSMEWLTTAASDTLALSGLAPPTTAQLVTPAAQAVPQQVCPAHPAGAFTQDTQCCDAGGANPKSSWEMPPGVCSDPRSLWGSLSPSLGCEVPSLQPSRPASQALPHSPGSWHFLESRVYAWPSRTAGPAANAPWTLGG